MPYTTRAVTLGGREPMHPCIMRSCRKTFRTEANLARHLSQIHGVRAINPRPMMKTHPDFCFITTAMTRLARALCKDLLRHAARNPTVPIDTTAIKQECQIRLMAEGKDMEKLVSKKQGSLGVDVKKPDRSIPSKEGTGRVLAFPRRAKMGRKGTPGNHVPTKRLS